MTKRLPRKKSDVGYGVILLVLTAIGLVTLYPLLYVVSMSISDPFQAYAGRVSFFPRGLSLQSYKIAFENADLIRAFGNSVFYTLGGTVINIVLTVMTAYVLVQERYFLRKTLHLLILFTMFFSGGMIPSYIMINKLGIFNTVWAMLLPTALDAFNVTVAVTYFRTVPKELYEAAYIDGANDLQVLFRIVIHMVKPIIATLVVFYAVLHWNNYFNALLYLTNKKLQPLQVYLVSVLRMGDESVAGGMEAGGERTMILSQLKYTVIVVTMLPIALIYPFMQKYFVSGATVGAVKG